MIVIRETEKKTTFADVHIGDVFLYEDSNRTTSVGIKIIDSHILDGDPFNVWDVDDLIPIWLDDYEPVELCPEATLYVNNPKFTRGF